MSMIKTGMLLIILSGLLLLAGALLGGISGIIVALAIALVFNFAMYWFSDKLALAMTRAREVTPEEEPLLHSIVDEQVQKAGIPKPRVYIMQNDSPNAFATGRNPRHAAVAATTGILRILKRDELGGVIAHELAHVGNRDTLIMTMVATIAMAIGFIAQMAYFGMLFGGFGGRGRGERGGSAPTAVVGIVGLLLVVILLPLVATLIRLAISRVREYQADASGAKTSGTPLALADALEKLERGSKQVPMEANKAVSHLFIVEPAHGQAMGFMNAQGMTSLFSTHPPIAERVKRLRNMPVGA